MRHVVICTLLAIVPVHVVHGQELVEFTSLEDSFRIGFPGRPQVQTGRYTSQYGYTLPSRTYTLSSGPERYSVMVVDYRGIEQQAIAKTCPKGPDSCPRREITAIIGEGEWRNDVRGAMLYALDNIIKRGSRVTSITFGVQDFVEGIMLQAVNADETRTYAWISMHDNRLYVVEGTAPAVGYPPLIAFQQNLSYLDAEGTVIRYRAVYSNAYHGLGDVPVPARSRPSE